VFLERSGGARHVRVLEWKFWLWGDELRLDQRVLVDRERGGRIVERLARRDGRCGWFRVGGVERCERRQRKWCPRRRQWVGTG
jgi:hypothetical protein